MVVMNYLHIFADTGTDIYLQTNDGSNCLHIATLWGHLNLCNALIVKKEFDVNIASNDGWTILHYAARNGSYELLKYFTDIGVDIDLKTNLGWNCLHIAAFYGHLNLCKKLIENHNFDVLVTDEDGWTALHHSARNGSYELVTYFAEMGTDIHVRNNSYWNCLHIAAFNGHLKLCQTLIEKHKFDVLMPNTYGWTALHCSAKSGSYELLSYFAAIGNAIDLKTDSRWNCLHIAALYGHLNLCKYLIDQHKILVNLADNGGWRALQISAKNGSYKLLTYFNEMGTDIDRKTNDGSNCLHIAALHGHLNLCKKLIENHNFDAKMIGNDGWSALHYSARNGSHDLVTYFAEMGTNILLKANDESNCLHKAALNGHLNLCKALIEKRKFGTHTTDNEGWTALHYSVRSGNYELVAYLAEKETDIYLKSDAGWSCLHIAAFYGHLNLCKTLIENNKFDIHMTDNDGWIALHYSARNGSYELLLYLADMETDIELKTQDISYSLYIAAFYGHLNICKNIVDNYNLDVHKLDNDGWIALHYAARNGSYKL